MGRPDQLAKRLLREETPAATRYRAVFEVPPEVPVGALEPDGVVRVVTAQGLAELPAPWSRIRRDVTLDVKMPGDHTDPAAFARCELRRHARWVRLLEAQRALPPEARETLDERDHGTWLVAPHLSRWVQDAAAAGRFTLEPVAAGCWHVGLATHETLWIAANELPLRVDLVPFLVARSGRALVEFLLWAVETRGVLWTRDVVEELDMGSNIADEILTVPHDAAEQYRIKTAFTRKLLQFYPEAANEIRDKAREEGLEKGLRQSILLTLTARKLELTDAQRVQVETESRVEVLQRWLTRAAVAARIDDVFAD